MKLELRQFSHEDTTVQMFAYEDAALQHITDHLLTGPECELWSLLEPSYWEIVGHPQDYGTRQDYLRSVVAGEESIQPLYDLYVSATCRDFQEAKQLGWFVEHNGSLYAIGTSAIFVVLKQQGGKHYCITTAYIPGQGHPEITRESRSRRKDWTTITRECEREDDRLIFDETGEHVTIERKEKKEHRKSKERDNGFVRFRRDRTTSPYKIIGRGQEEVLFYVGFRPAIQFIRSRRYDEAITYAGTSVSWRDIHRLVAVLPSLGALSFEKWKEIRNSVTGITCGSEVKT